MHLFKLEIEAKRLFSYLIVWVLIELLILKNTTTTTKNANHNMRDEEKKKKKAKINIYINNLANF